MLQLSWTDGDVRFDSVSGEHGDIAKFFKILGNNGRRLFERKNGRVLFVDCPQREITPAQPEYSRSNGFVCAARR
jgi:hypothetical protein